MTCTHFVRCLLVILPLWSVCPNLIAQSVLEEKLDVADELRPLDTLLRDQLRECCDARDAALSEDGKQTPEWWATDARLNPLTVHGRSVLSYARGHVGTPASLICLAYIIDFGEGEPADVYRLAGDELIANHQNSPAVSWICSRCTNALYLDEMRSFLTRIRQASTNPDVRAAATFHLAELLDAAVQAHGMIADTRDRFKTTGVFEALPAIDRRLRSLARLNPDELAAERDKLLELVVARHAEQKPWAVTYTPGRLNYEFQENRTGKTYGQHAKGLAYEVKNLRVGCIAPDFKGTDIEGQPFRLADRRGKPTLLMFSHKGCVPCVAMYPELRTVQERFSETGFSVIGVMVDEDVDTVTGAVTAGDISWPCVWDGPSGPIAETFRVRNYPTVLLLDRNGQITAMDQPLKRHLVEHIEKVVQNE